MPFPVVLVPSSLAKSMPLTKRTVLVNAEPISGCSAFERGGERNVSSHVGNTRFGGAGTRGDARPDPLDGAGETDTRFLPLVSSGFLSDFAFGFVDGDGERGGAGLIFATCVSRTASLPVRASDVATSAAVSSSPSSISITSIVFSSRCSISVMRLASKVLELKNEAQPDTFVAMDDWMGLAGSNSAVGGSVVRASLTSASALLGLCACAWLSISIPSMAASVGLGAGAVGGWLYDPYQDHGDNQLEPRFSSVSGSTLESCSDVVFKTSVALGWESAVIAASLACS